MLSVICQQSAEQKPSFFFMSSDFFQGHSLTQLKTTDERFKLILSKGDTIQILDVKETAGTPLVLSPELFVVQSPPWQPSALLFYDNKLKALGNAPAKEAKDIASFIQAYRPDYLPHSIRIDGAKFSHLHSGVYFNEQNLISCAGKTVKLANPALLPVTKASSVVKNGALIHFDVKSEALSAYALDTGAKLWSNTSFFKAYKGNVRYNVNSYNLVYGVDETTKELSLGVAVGKHKTQVSIFNYDTGEHVATEVISSALFPIFVGGRNYLIWEEGFYKIVTLS